ncbi:MAG: recombinase family protein [Bacteroidota bacterium]
MNIPTSIQARKFAVGYVRCSTDLQEDSPEQQKKEILAFAETQGFSIIEWFVDFGKSGTTFDQRPEFQRLRRTVQESPKFQAVICYDESRWGRAIDAEENTYWRVHFRMCGVEVLLVKTSVDPKHEFAPMLKAFEGVQASQYSKKLSELTLRGAKSNGIYSNGGSAPYGYKRIAVNMKTGTEREPAVGEYVVRHQEKVKWGKGLPEEIQTVHYIFEQRSMGVGYVLIAEALNQKNIPCPKRGRWRNKDQKWSTVTVKTIIQNPTYYGARVYNRNSMSSIQAQSKGRDLKKHTSYPHWTNHPNEWTIVENAHEALVTKELWEKANSLNHTRTASTPNRHSYKSPYLLTGLIKCSSCGFAFQGWSGSAKGISYSKYIDGGWKNKRVCTFLAIPKEKLERFAIQAVKDTLADPLTLDNIEHHLQLMFHAEPKQKELEIESIERAIEENQLRRRNLMEIMELRKDGASLSTLIDRLEQLEGEKKYLEGRLYEATKITENEDLSADTAQAVASYLLNFEEVFENADPFKKKLLLKRSITSLLVDRQQGVVRLAVSRIPAVTTQLEQLLQKETAATKVVTAVSSGGRT